MYQQDVIVKDSNNSFKLRTNGFIRNLGVSQIIGTKKYLDIEFIGGSCIRVFILVN